MKVIVFLSMSMHSQYQRSCHKSEAPESRAWLKFQLDFASSISLANIPQEIFLWDMCQDYKVRISHFDFFSFSRCPKTDTTSTSSTLCQTSTCWPRPSTGPAGSLSPPSPRTSGTAPGHHLMGPGGVMSLLWTSSKKTPSMFIFMMFNILSGKTLLDYQVYFLFLVWCFT